jgi:large subunit ribosomal protein L13
MSTFVPSGKNIVRKWYVVDADGQTLGRLATKAASLLAGKLNPQYVPYIDMGDHVIVINAEKVRLTGLKAQSKLYRRYTGFPGGLREESFTRLINRKPEKVLEEAIRGMLPTRRRSRWPSTSRKGFGCAPERSRRRVKREWLIWFNTTERAAASRRLLASFCGRARASGR